MKKYLFWFTLCSFALSPLTSLAQANLGTAQSYLSAHSDNPWSTMALTVLGANSISSDYLKSVSGTTAIEYAAPILALTALNKDPWTFGDEDYVAELKTFHTGNQLGDPGTVNDDIFGLLALLSAGEPTSDATIDDAKNFILAHQQPDGGWGFAVSSGSDSNMTAAAIVALIADGVSSASSEITNGFNYLKTAQNDDGGFTYDPLSSWGTASDSSSTAWAIWALNAAHISPADWTKANGDPVSYLESNQDATGYFQYQAGSGEDSFSATTTAYAVIALAGKTLPLNIFQPPVVVPVQNNTSGGGNSTPPQILAPTVPPVPEIIPVTPGQVLAAITYAPGTLVKSADDATVYIVANDKFRPFSSETIFLAYGLKFSDVQIINSNLLLDNLGSIMDYPDGTPHE